MVLSQGAAIGAIKIRRWYLIAAAAVSLAAATTVRRVLEDLLKWEPSQADAYAVVLSQAAEHGGGGLPADVPRTVHDCPDHEDNLVLGQPAISSAWPPSAESSARNKTSSPRPSTQKRSDARRS